MNHRGHAQVRGRLVVTPLPHVVESAIGYSLRLTQANGYQSPTLFLPGGPLATQSLRGGDAHSLTLLTGMSPEAASRLEVSKVGPGYGMFGHVLSLKDIRLLHHSICPLCVEEDGFFDASWHLNGLTHCARHRVELLRQCPACNSGLTLVRPGVGVCRCKASLTNVELGATCSPTLQKLMLTIRAKLFDDPKIACAPREFSHLEQIPLSTFLALIRSMHRYVAKPLYVQVSGRLMSSAAMEVVARALLALKSGILAAQEVLLPSRKGSSSTTPRNQLAFDWYFGSKFGLHKLPELLFIGDAIRAAIRRDRQTILLPMSARETREPTRRPARISPKGGARPKRMRSTAQPVDSSLTEATATWEQEWMPLAEAADQSGCSVGSLRRAMDANLLRSSYPRKQLAVLHRTEVARLGPSAREGLDCEDAAAFIGITSTFLGWLVTSRTIQLSHIPMTGGLYSWEDVNAVRSLLRTARGRVLPYHTYMTVPRFLNSSPSVQRSSACKVFRALSAVDTLKTTNELPPPRAPRDSKQNWYLMIVGGSVTDDSRPPRSFRPLGNREPEESSDWMERLHP